MHRAARPLRPCVQVLERRKGVNMRVNVKEPGDVFGEVSLLYNCPRTATVAATTDAVVWVLERETFRCGARAGDPRVGVGWCARACMTGWGTRRRPRQPAACGLEPPGWCPFRAILR